MPHVRELEACAGGGGNLLEASIRAARARATVGEISMAMEKVFGRHRAESQALSGVYGGAYRGDSGIRRHPGTGQEVRAGGGAPDRACSWRRWGRTGTTAAPR